MVSLGWVLLLGAAPPLSGGAAFYSGLPASLSPAEVQAGVDAAIQAGAEVYHVPPSPTPYLFHNMSLAVEHAAHLSVVLGENAFIFSVGAGVLVRDCINVSLVGGVVAYDPPPSAQGLLVTAKTTPGTYHGRPTPYTAGEVVLDARFPAPTAGAQCLLWGAGNVLSPGCWRCCLAVQCPPGSDGVASVASLGVNQGRQAGGTKVCIKTTGNFSVGTAVSWSNYRSGFTVTLVNCTRCNVRDTNIVAATFMAVTEFGGGGGNTYEGVRVGWHGGTSAPYTPLVWKGGQVLQPRLSSNADLFHSYGTRRGPAVKNCTFSNAADDFFNVHNEIQVAFSLNGGFLELGGGGAVGPLYLVDPHSPVSTDLNGNGAQAGAPRTTYGTVSSLDYARAGDTLNLTTPWTFKHVATAKIRSIARTRDAGVLKAAAAVYARVCKKQDCAKGPATFVYKVVLDAFVDKGSSAAATALLLADGVDATVVEQSAAGAVVENCTFMHTNANLGRWKSPNSKIVNNTFVNARMCNLEVTALQTYLEGTTYIPNVTIADNLFVGFDNWCNASSIHPGSMANVKIFGNVFKPSAFSAIPP